jgi:hypothetical protein
VLKPVMTNGMLIFSEDVDVIMPAQAGGSAAHSLAFSPDGRQLGASSGDACGNLWLIDIAAATARQLRGGLGGPIVACLFCHAADSAEAVPIEMLLACTHEGTCGPYTREAWLA